MSKQKQLPVGCPKLEHNLTAEPRLRCVYIAEDGAENCAVRTMADYPLLLRHLRKEVSGSTTREYDYIYSPEGLAAIAVKTGNTRTVYYAHTDHLGSLRRLTDAGKNVISRYHYDAWGKRTLVAGSNITSRGFTGHEHLDEFGLINMNVRLYDPVIGRFLSPDPYVPDWTYSQDYNRYMYARNNPLIYTDPTGEKWWKVALGIADVLSGGALSATALITAHNVSASALIGAGTLSSTSIGLAGAASTIPVTPGLLSGTVTLTAASTLTGVSAFVSSTAVNQMMHSTANSAILLPIQQTLAAADMTWYLMKTLPKGHDDFTYLKNYFTMELGLLLHIPGWETSQALLGNTVGHFRNMTGKVDEAYIDWSRLAVVINDVNKDKNGGWGFTLGQYIISENIAVSDLYQHESGHVMQSRLLGPLYFSRAAIPSLLSFRFGFSDYHNRSWYEIWASRWGGAYASPQNYRHKSFWYWLAILGLPSFPY